jgi:hypothetical protein
MKKIDTSSGDFVGTSHEEPINQRKVCRKEMSGKSINRSFYGSMKHPAKMQRDFGARWEVCTTHTISYSKEERERQEDGDHQKEYMSLPGKGGKKMKKDERRCEAKHPI